MKVGIIGSGGREHAICTFLRKSQKVDEIYCFPGNAGTDQIAKNIKIDLDDFEKLSEFIKTNKIDIVIVGPEKPLVMGIVDEFEKKGIKVFGPNKAASQLEGSKIFTKKLCKNYNIPTAEFGIFAEIETASNFLRKSKFPLVVKADGLAAGKGVYICNNEKEAMNAINEIFNGKFGKAKEVLIEEFLDGEEMSFFIISDGREYKIFGTAQDHKKVFEGDKGKNTGGMGAYTPSRLENAILNNKIIEKIIEPTFKALKEFKISFKGFLYAGLMIKNNEPFLIEYNVRMGDPECQTILPQLRTDLAEIFESCVNENLKLTEIKWSNKKTICIVLCSKGYPDEYKKNLEIKNLENISLRDNEYIFHAGTIKKNNIFYSNGGRVLNFVISSDDLKLAREKAINIINQINWKYGFFRNDIGYKIIDK
tara:strand:- start:1692 stop:2957 length:1266 start_codon:yes stop_codon:yes gene_type:complete